MLDETSIKERMQKTVENVRRDLAKIRTGVATPAILDNVYVDYYGTKTPISQAAAITVPEPRCLAIKPWDKSLMQAIERAILTSNIGINPVNDGTFIRLNMPVLTGERRKELAKFANKIGEEGKVAIRNIRRDENEHLKKSSKDAGHSEDELKHEMDKVQALTDKFIAEVDKVIAEKEKDILTV
ncbi:MAG: ribosome recycling factor [Fibrobacteres bacterium]|jgi:ribosome recycling factor|nr:ribosome recycling factor [Fibrobacterota bacterium]